MKRYMKAPEFDSVEVHVSLDAGDDNMDWLIFNYPNGKWDALSMKWTRANSIDVDEVQFLLGYNVRTVVFKDVYDSHADKVLPGTAKDTYERFFKYWLDPSIEIQFK